MNLHIRLCILIWILADFAAVVEGTGIITQVTVAHRAKQYFDGSKYSNVDYNKILADNHDAVIAGSVFPDAFRECAGGQYRHVSEDSHYGGFLNATINYIRQHYPHPWNNETEKLVAFLFGVSSNQVSTMLWEGIGVSQGFLDTLANVNFHGSYKEARKSADFGADAIILFKSDVDYLGFDQQWYFPVDDLFKIYQEYYGTTKITADVIDNCTTLQVLEEIAELALLSEAHTEVTKVSPFLADQTKDYFLGGINDMTGWTYRIWSETVQMLENGTESCDVPKNTLLINCNKHKSKRQHQEINEHHSEPGRENTLLKASGFTIDDVIVTKTRRGKSVEAKRKLKDLLMFLGKSETTTRKVRLKQTMDKEDDPDDYENYLYYSNHTFSKLGWAMTAADLDGDGNEDLVVGAPGYSEKGDFQKGRVYIIYSNENGIPRIHHMVPWERIEESLNYTIHFSGQSKAQSRYGSSVALLDVNLDGVLDMAVGAPSFSNSGSLGYNGIVYIYFGKQGLRLTQGQPDITITCQTTNCNLGFSLTVTDFNKDGHDDLILGTPFYSKELNQSGIVSALPSMTYKGPINVTIESLITKFSLSGKQEYSWFGYSMRAKSNVLMVSQPYYRKCGRQDCRISPNDTQGAGAVTLYNFETKIQNHGFIFTGDKEFDMAGTGADIGFPFLNNKPIFAVGVPGASVYGRQYGIPFHFSQGGTVLLYDISGSEVKLVSNFDGDRLYSRFGKFVLFDDLNGDNIDDLIISAPQRTKHIIPLLEESIEIAGTVYTFFGGSNFPVGNQTNSVTICSNTYPCPKEVANKTTDASLGQDSGSFYGDSLVVLKDKMANSLISSFGQWNYPDTYEFGRTGFTTTKYNRK